MPRWQLDGRTAISHNRDMTTPILPPAGLETAVSIQPLAPCGTEAEAQATDSGTSAMWRALAAHLKAGEARDVAATATKGIVRRKRAASLSVE